MGRNKTSCFNEILDIQPYKSRNASYEAKLDFGGSIDHASIRLALALFNLYSYFNQHIFSSILPQLVIRLSDDPRRLSFYKDRSWVDENGKVLSEISISKHSLLLTPIEICQLIVRQMVSHLQHSFGKPGLDNYNNVQFFQLMKVVGLGCATKNGGRVTGRQVIDYIIPDGLFERTYSRMPEDLKIPFLPNENIEPPLRNPNDNENKKPISDRNKVKYSCPVCKLNVWGRSDLRLRCKECERDLTEIIPFIK